MTRGGGMREVELDDGTVDVAPAAPKPSYGRRRWWVAGVAGVVVLGGLGLQLLADARERAAVARLAEVPGVLAPLDERLPVLWQSDTLKDLQVTAVAHGAFVGPVVGDDGSQALVARDLATGAVRWSNPLYGPDAARARAATASGASVPVCVPTTDDPEPSQVACLVSDGFLRFGADTEAVPATTTFVRVIDSADGRTVAQWDATGTSLSVLDGVAVLGAYAGTDGAITLDAHDLLTGDSRWTTTVPAPDPPLGEGEVFFPPPIARIGAYLEVYRTYAVEFYDATGQRVHTEVGAETPGAPQGGQALLEPRSGRVVYSRGSTTPGYSSNIVLGGDQPSFTHVGDVVIPSVDDGSGPGLLLFAVPDPRHEGSLMLQGVDVETREPLWEAHVPVRSQPSGAIVVRGRVYVLTTTGLAAVDARTGEVRWSVDAPKGREYGPPMTDGHHVLVTVRRHDDYSDGDLVALDPGSGEQAWRSPLPADVEWVFPVGDALLGAGTGSDGRVAKVVRFG